MLCDKFFVTLSLFDCLFFAHDGTYNEHILGIMTKGQSPVGRATLESKKRSL